MCDPNSPCPKFGPPAKPGKLREFVGLPAASQEGLRSTSYDPNQALEIYTKEYLRKDRHSRDLPQKFSHRYQHPPGGDAAVSLFGDTMPGGENIAKIYKRVGFEADPRTRRWLVGKSMHATAPASEYAESTASSHRPRTSAVSVATSRPQRRSAAEEDTMSRCPPTPGSGGGELSRSDTAPSVLIGGGMQTSEIRFQNRYARSLTNDLFVNSRLTLL